MHVANQMCVCVFFFIRFYATEITIKSHHVVLFWYRVTELSQQFFAFKFGSIFNICFSNAIIPSISELYKLFRIDTGISLEFFFLLPLLSVFFVVLYSFLVNLSHVYIKNHSAIFFISLFHNIYFQFVFISIGELNTTTLHFYLNQKKIYRNLVKKNTTTLFTFPTLLLLPNVCCCRFERHLRSKWFSHVCLFLSQSPTNQSLLLCISENEKKRKNDKHQIK